MKQIHDSLQQVSSAMIEEEDHYNFEDDTQREECREDERRM